MILSKLKRKFSKYQPVIKKAFLVLVIIFFSLVVYKFGSWFWKLLQPLAKMTQSIELRQSNERVNLLVLGAGGTNHIGSDLTDSILFASVDLKSGETVLLSVPRDVWLDSLRAKINTAYYYGEEKKQGGGLILSKAAVSEVLGQPIHYGLLLDFDGFVRAIDLVEGVEIDVERAFDDYQYPVPGMEQAEPEELRYEHLHFNAGFQTMNGSLALKYVRSRYAEGEEGTDFARSQRQQKLLLAFKDKVFSMKTFFNPKKIRELAGIFGDSVKTDINEREYSEFLKLSLKIKESKIKAVALGDDLFINPPKNQYENQWVLVPKNNDWQAVYQYIEELLTSNL